MILIALGGNLSAAGHGTPVKSLQAALAALSDDNVAVRCLSPWYETDPVPTSDQPKFSNAVAWIETALPPDRLLARMHEVEAAFGRVREVRNEARPVDLDLLDYQGQVLSGETGGPVLPHPRMHERAFVLIPLRDIVPDWRHPVLDTPIDALIAGLPRPHGVRPL